MLKSENALRRSQRYNLVTMLRGLVSCVAEHCHPTAPKLIVRKTTVCATNGQEVALKVCLYPRFQPKPRLELISKGKVLAIYMLEKRGDLTRTFGDTQLFYRHAFMLVSFFEELQRQVHSWGFKKVRQHQRVAKKKPSRGPKKTHQRVAKKKTSRELKRALQRWLVVEEKPLPDQRLTIADRFRASQAA